MNSRLAPAAARSLLVGVFLVLFGSPALAGTMSASLSSSKIHVGEGTTLEVQVSGQFQGQPRFAEIPVVSLHLVGQSSQTSISRGRATQSYTFTYRVNGLVPGKATLGPAKLEVDGRELRSEYFQIEVLPRRKGGNQAQSRSGRATFSGRSPRAAGADAGYFAEAKVSDERPWVGESLLYSVEIGSTVPPRDVEWEPPTWTPLSPEPYLALEQEDMQRVIDGSRYTVNRIDVPLFAIEAGEVKLEPARFSMTLVRGRGFFGAAEQVPFDSNDVQLKVRPLPKSGRPTNFTGAVGNYSIQAQLDLRRLAAGEAATLKVMVEGTGALRGEPLTIAPPEGIRSYDEAPTIEAVLKDDGVRSRATYSTTLVPLTPGTYEIPAIKFSFFEPDQERYRSVSTRPLSLEVTGEAVTDPAVVTRSAALGQAKEEVQILGVDILPLHTGAKMRSNQHLSPTAPWFLALLLLPFFGFVGSLTQVRRQRFAGTDAGQERRRRVAAKAAAKAGAQAGQAGDLAETERALRAFLTARLQERGASLGPDEAAGVLAAAGADQDLSESLVVILGRLEEVRYGGASAQGLEAKIADWLNEAQRSWR